MAKTSPKALAYIKQWKQRNHEKVLEQQARWRARHPTYERDWRRRNPKKVQAYRKHTQEGRS